MESTIVFDKLWFRRSIGILGFILPIAVVLGGCFLGVEVQPSLSHYYHTEANGIFVFVFAALGLFVYAYRGYNSLERSAGFVVLVTSFMIGMFSPLSEEVSKELSWNGDGAIPEMIVDGHIHFVGTVLFFLIFWFFTWSFSEPRGDRMKRYFDCTGLSELPDNKKKRNLVYKCCFWIMAVLGAIAVVAAVIEGDVWYVVLICEWGIMWTFSLAWFTKGQLILRD